MNKLIAMKCPKCRKKATIEHFRESEECSAYVASMCALYRGSKRQAITKAGGRPPIIKTCPTCGFTGNATAYRSHKCA